MKPYPAVALHEVLNLPDPASLQSQFELYLADLVPSVPKPRSKSIPNLAAPNVLRVIGNPFLVTKNHLAPSHPSFKADLPKGIPSCFGKVACTVLNAAPGWAPYHFFDTEDDAEGFFDTTAAIMKDDYIVVNAHLKAGGDVVHELIHSYHGDDGRFDWFMNEGLTDWFAVDFSTSGFGGAFHYDPALMYAGGRMVVNDLVAVIGAKRIAALFFGEERNGKFEKWAKESSKTLMQMAQFNQQAQEYLKHNAAPPIPIWPLHTEEAAKSLATNGEITARLRFSVMVENLKRL